MTEYNPKAPKILNDIVEAVSKANFKAVKADTDRRIDSKKDEEIIIAWLMLQPQFQGRVREDKLRAFGDFIATDEQGVDHYVNIKTSIGSTDNVFSKLGFIWAFTDVLITEIPNKITNKKWFQLITTRKTDVPNRDYWFLAFDKADMSQVMIRGVKQIENWMHNPSNNLQVTWRKEHVSPLKEYTFDEAWYRVIVDGVLRCWEKDYSGKAEGLLYRQEQLAILETQKALDNPTE